MKTQKDALLVALGEAIRVRRVKRKLSSYNELASLAGVSENYMGAIERGEHNASYRTLSRVANALGCSLSKLFREAEEAVVKEEESDAS